MIIKKLFLENTINKPSDILSELVRSAIDAKSEEIIIQIDGLEFIEVRDNGESIKKEEVLNLSSSRVKMLYSISNISKVHIKSGFNEMVGYEFILESGKLVDFRNTYVNKGTTVIVRNLFFNLPNRKSSLLSSDFEFQKIKDIILNYSLLFQNIAFNLKINGEVYNFEKVISREERIEKIFGNFQKKVLKTSKFNLEIYTLEKKFENRIFFNSNLIKDEKISKILAKFQVDNYLVFISTQYSALEEIDLYKELQKFLSSNKQVKILPKVIYSIENSKSDKNNFLITISKNKILIIHRDRALYKIYLQKLKNRQFTTKSLPLPYTFKQKLDDETIKVMKLYSINVIKGKGTITITTVPDIIENINYEDLGKILEKMKMREHLFEVDEFLNEVANVAVKYSQLEDNEIIPMLLSLKNPEFDESNRRIIYEIDLDEIRNKF